MYMHGNDMHANLHIRESRCNKTTSVIRIEQELMNDEPVNYEPVNYERYDKQGKCIFRCRVLLTGARTVEISFVSKLRCCLRG